MTSYKFIPAKSGNNFKIIPAKSGSNVKNRTVVEYALNDSDKPIGVATYQIIDSLLEKMKDLLPSPEEIENRLKDL